MKMYYYFGKTSIILTWFMFINLSQAASITKHKAEDGAWTGGRTVNSDYQVLWKYDSDSEDIMFEITGKVAGYVALGITTTGSMKDADMFVAWVKDGVPHVIDCHGPSNGNGVPIVDTQQDVELIAGTEEGGETTVRFKRKLRTCDQNDIDITVNTMKMIWAFGTEEPESAADISQALYHQTNRGHFDTYLLTNKPPNPVLPEDSIRIDLQMKNITIPNTDTTYWCDWFKIERSKDLGGKKHHLIMSHVIIGGHQQGNHPYVHHLVFYRCRDLPENWSEEEEREGGGPCFDGVSKFNKVCSREELIAAWAVGGEPFYFPEHVGLPIGETETEYFLMEMHYDNPRLEPGVVDDSGVQMILTPTLRQHEAGTMINGLNSMFFLMIPPGQAEFTAEGFCHQNCTSSILPSDGINVFAGLLHTHLLGVGVTSRHFRGDQELPYVLQDTNYDFNYQDMIMLDDEVKILPGDALATKCHYDSRSRDKVTFGGLSTREEMCITFFFYYPKTEMFICTTNFPAPEAIGPALGVNTFYENPNYYNTTTNQGVGPFVEVNGVNMTWVDYLNEYEWSDEKAASVERLGHSEDRYYVCGINEATQNILNNPLLPPLNINNIYVPPSAEPCSSSSPLSTSASITLEFALVVFTFIANF